MVGKVVLVYCACVASLSMPVQAQVASARDAESTPAAVTVNPRAEAFAVRRVSIDVRDVSLRTALEMVATQAGLTLLHGKTVLENAPQVSVHQTDVSAKTAFMAVLRGANVRVVLTESGQAVLIRTEVPVASVSGGVTGKVTDAKTGKPVVGAYVAIEGAKPSVQTGNDGTFRLTSVPAGSQTLVVRRIGYMAVRKSLTVTDNQNIPINVVIETAATPLDEVVTTATGLQRRVEIGNDIGRINADSLVKTAPITTLSELLQSRVPGLSVQQGQGTVGGDVKLQIRGPSSILLSDEPVVVVDGIRYNSRPAGRALVSTERMALSVGHAAGASLGNGESVSPLNDLNPNDIETVEVVKGPSAATLYGADAANGVIVITTKRGRSGPARWNVYSTRDYTVIPDENLLTDKQYYGWGTRRNGTKSSDCDIIGRLRNNCRLDSLIVVRSINTDEKLSFYKPSYPWTVGANVSGGSQALRYFMAGSYNNAEGAISIPDTVQALLHSAGAVLPKDFLRPNGQTMLNLSSNVAASAGTNIDLTIGGYYTRASTRSISVNNTFLNDLRAGSINPANGADGITRSVAQSLSGASEEANDRFVTNATGQARLTPWLAVNGVVGLDHATRNLNEFRERDSTQFVRTPGEARDVEGASSVLTANSGASATTRRGRLSAQTTIGVNYVRSTEKYLTAEGEDLVPGTQSVEFAAIRYVFPSYSQIISLGSFAEQRLGWNERLFVTAAVRADGSSAFGEGYHAKGYPKFSLSWLLSQEPLFPQLPGLTELRLRSAYGVAGRQPGATDRLATLQVGTAEQCRAGARCLRQTVGNAQLRPERSTEWEGGLDAGLLGQRMQLGLSWYSRRTRDQILYEWLPSGMGGRLTNLGLATQGGFEAQATAMLIETRPLSLTVTMNHSNYHTKVVDLGDVQPVKVAGGGFVEGYPLGARFIVPFLGYEDKNGDGMLFESTYSSGDPLDEIFSGSSHPDSLVYVGTSDAPRRQNMTAVLGLWSNRLRLSANLTREAGSTVLLNGCARCRGAYDSTATLEEQAMTYRMRFIGLPVSATFTRLREVSAALTLPARLLRHLRVSSGSIALSGRNLGLWTSTKMPDPESRAIGTGKPRAENTGWGVPQAQQWAFRIDLGL